MVWAHGMSDNSRFYVAHLTALCPFPDMWDKPSLRAVMTKAICWGVFRNEHPLEQAAMF